MGSPPHPPSYVILYPPSPQLHNIWTSPYVHLLPVSQFSGETRGKRSTAAVSNKWDPLIFLAWGFHIFLAPPDHWEWTIPSILLALSQLSEEVALSSHWGLGISSATKRRRFFCLPFLNVNAMMSQEERSYIERSVLTIRSRLNVIVFFYHSWLGKGAEKIQ